MKSKIGGSTYCKQDLGSELQGLKTAGYNFAELDLGLPIKPNKNLENKLKRAETTIPVLIGHLPEIDFKKEEVERCKKFIGILSEYNIKLFVVHLFSRHLPTKTNLAFKIEQLKNLAKFAEEKNCILTLENTEEDIDILKKVFDAVPKLYFCLDIGHANLFAKENRSISLINEFSHILKHIHVHDNVSGDDEKFDLHLPIGAGKINFTPIFDRLKEINYSGNITLEIYNPDKEYRESSINRIKSLL